ncbi:MAG TPA: tetratricopeptide repeat protein [Myxococcales bacterium]|nr:tetratricopeptide repeat protein [Myxococcales bacterium]
MTVERAAARAEAALRLARWDEAMRAAAELIAADPDDSTGFAMLSRAHLGKNEFKLAQKAAEDGLARTPNREWLHRLRCHALRLQGRYDDAVAAAEECVRLMPGASESHGARAKALAALGRREEAMAAYDRAIALDPHDALLHRELGDLLLSQAPAEAERHYRAALAINPSDAVTLNNFGASLARQKRPDEAALAFKSAILADPTLRVAKQNAHSTLSSQLGAAAGIGGALWIALQAVRVAGTVESGIAIGAMLLAGFAYLVWRLVQKIRRSERLEALKAKDQQLYEIFTRLEADKKAGRL